MRFLTHLDTGSAAGRLSRLAVVLVVGLGLGACADVTANPDAPATLARLSAPSVPQTTAVQLAADPSVATDAPQLAALEDTPDYAHDPLEPFNKTMFGINEFALFFLQPVTRNYDALTPPWVKDRVSSVFDNAAAPVTLANDLLQQEWDRAFVTFQRFLINSSFGILGLFDMADAHFGLPPHKEDFGQTLGTYGVGDEIYLVLPLIGPTNPRDMVGRFVDGYFDPFTYLAHSDVRTGRSVASGVLSASDAQPKLDEVRKSSVDYYAAIRALYRQRRQSEIDNGTASSLQNLPAMTLIDDGEWNDPGVAEEGPTAAGQQSMSVGTN
ncbi:MlaA family lipoprotein [Roseospirillum parvum]|uniref:Phospholipid-binding lipoprotein MlaA n=1 Tax=Roseospirillum parvum TaxID=83401 RepID=A0A1G7XQS9_9PROT|nr:VacJ family lipoprotein [Roseospirillum parvum]SDG86562.1 phospholipid-binding lipoprotein MlaA [Roseospirillum parvum]